MQNLIGDSISELPKITAMPGTLVNDYGKSEIRQGRKMGHFTTIFDKN
jgi:5-(carboxyamino)imidazole ribonucleotide synthase